MPYRYCWPDWIKLVWQASPHCSRSSSHRDQHQHHDGDWQKPEVHHYWSTDPFLGNAGIQAVLPRDHFESLTPPPQGLHRCHLEETQATIPSIAYILLSNMNDRVACCMCTYSMLTKELVSREQAAYERLPGHTRSFWRRPHPFNRSCASHSLRH